MLTRELKAARDECEAHYVDRDRVARVRRAMAEPETVHRLAETFKLLGDPTRTRILMALAREELCVCDLAGLLGISSSAVSHQLRLLRHADLVRYRRAGKMAYYALSDHHVEQVFALGLEHVQERGTPGRADERSEEAGERRAARRLPRKRRDASNSGWVNQ